MEVGIADDGQIIAVGRKRLQCLAHLKIAADLFRRPVMFVRAFARASSGAVDHLEASQARRRDGGGQMPAAEGA